MGCYLDVLLANLIARGSALDGMLVGTIFMLNHSDLRGLPNRQPNPVVTIPSPHPLYVLCNLPFVLRGVSNRVTAIMERVVTRRDSKLYDLVDNSFGTC